MALESPEGSLPVETASGASARMKRISLVIPSSADHSFNSEDIETYRSALEEHAGQTPVEVVLAGAVEPMQGALEGSPAVCASPEGQGRVSSLRAGLRAASGDCLVVLDPERRYPPEALGQLLDGLNSTGADLAI